MAGDRLTARQFEVARLVAEHLSNGEIAARLQISEGTVKYHLSEIKHVLGVTKKREIPGALRSQGLVNGIESKQEGEKP